MKNSFQMPRLECKFAIINETDIFYQNLIRKHATFTLEIASLGKKAEKVQNSPSKTNNARQKV